MLHPGDLCLMFNRQGNKTFHLAHRINPDKSRQLRHNLPALYVCPAGDGGGRFYISLQ